MVGFFIFNPIKIVNQYDGLNTYYFNVKIIQGFEFRNGLLSIGGRPYFLNVLYFFNKKIRAFFKKK